MRNGRSDDDDVWESLRLTGVAVVSAFIVGAAVSHAVSLSARRAERGIQNSRR